MPTCRLYLITPSAIDDLAAFGRVLAEALDAGDVAALQIRLKDADDEVIAAGASRPADVFKAHQCKPQCARCVCEMREMIDESREALRYAAE